MAIMRCDHPDILEFVHVKSVEGSLKNFNVSVGLTDDFMREVVSGSTEPWTCNFGGKGYPLRRINRGSTNLDYTRYEITDVEMTASEVFEEIVTCAWKNGEPGCVFLDKVNETNPVPGLGRIEASNPCGRSERGEKIPTRDPHVFSQGSSFCTTATCAISGP